MQRTIGAKKDEFRLNRKHIAKSDVVNLLESAGFSRSNPYYIVRQGKVDRICKMSNAERLHLLMEVAGTKVYDDRKRQSDKIMEDSKTRRQQITDILQVVTARLGELEQQKAELLQYQELDKRSRALKYCVFNFEHEHTRDELARAHTAIDEEKEKLVELNAAAANDAASVREHQLGRDNATHAADAARRELARLDNEATELEELKQSLTIKLAALAKQIDLKVNEEKELSRESAAVAEEIATVRAVINDDVRCCVPACVQYLSMDETHDCFRCTAQASKCPSVFAVCCCVAALGRAAIPIVGRGTSRFDQGTAGAHHDAEHTQRQVAPPPAVHVCGRSRRRFGGGNRTA